MKYPRKTDVNELLQLLRERDSIQIGLLIDSIPHLIGVRSDYETRGQGLYFAKHFWINERDYLSPVEFSHALTKLAARSVLMIGHIDKQD